MRVDKKGTIDLVTDVDVAVERMFRELVAERFPDHQVLAEEIGGDAAVPRGPCWVFDPIDGTTNFAHGLPIFCASLALEIDGVAEVAAVYDPNRRELFTAERGGGAFLNGRPLHVSDDRGARRRDAGHRVSVRRAFEDRGNRRAVRRVRRTGARRPAARIGGDRSLLRRRGAHGRILGERPQALGHRRRRADRGRGRRPRHEHGRERRSPRAAGTCSPATASSTTRCSRSFTRSGTSINRVAAGLAGRRRPPEGGRYASVCVSCSGRFDIRERHPGRLRGLKHACFPPEFITSAGISPATESCR